MNMSQLLNARRMITKAAARELVLSLAVNRKSAHAPAASPASQESAPTSTSASTAAIGAVTRATTPKAHTRARVPTA